MFLVCAATATMFNGLALFMPPETVTRKQITARTTDSLSQVVPAGGFCWEFTGDAETIVQQKLTEDWQAQADAIIQTRSTELVAFQVYEQSQIDARDAAIQAILEGE